MNILYTTRATSTGGREGSPKAADGVLSVTLSTSKDLVDRAHIVCPYSNATKGNVPVTLTIA